MRLFVGVVLVALVAWPERHVRAFVTDFRHGGSGVDARLMALFEMAARQQGRRIVNVDSIDEFDGAAYRLYEIELSPDERASFRRVWHRRLFPEVVDVGPRTKTMYRDAGLHVLVDIVKDAWDG